MKTVMAQGTFDVVHPGHIHYLEKSAELGDKLVVVIARDSRSSERKEQLIFNEEDRRKIIESLEAVDKAILGSKKDIYTTVEKVSPDIITLGHDQDHSVDEVKELAENTLDREVEVTKIETGTEHSSSDIKKAIKD